MINNLWLKEEKKFLKFIKDVKIPNEFLDDVDFIIPNKVKDFDNIPATGGCYWIWTNEPVLHCLHKNKIPISFQGGEIIYNGIAKDNVRGRAIHHLLGNVDAGWSGISIDLYLGNTISHRKKALSNSGKVPYIIKDDIRKKGNFKKGYKKGDQYKKYIPIKNKEELSNIYLSEEEKKEFQKLNDDKIYFRNGISIMDKKHNNFEFRVYFITGLSSLYLDFIEKKWREDFGLPKLCSYSKGR